MTTPDPVPRSLRLAAAIAWRALLLAAALAVLAFVLGRLRVIVVPVAVALLFSTFLVGPTRKLRELGAPNALAALAVLLAALVVVGGVTAALVPTVVSGWSELDPNVEGGVTRATDWLSDGPLDLSEQRVERWRDQTETELRSNSSRIARGVFGGAFLAIELLAGLALAVVTIFFVLKDGATMWRWFVGLFPRHVQSDVEEIGSKAWETAGGYLRGVSLVALVDAVAIGLALWALGVPLVLPLAALTFVGGFFPIVGAFVAGFAAAMVALLSQGAVAAGLVILATLVVQQLEGNVLQPLIVGNAVRVHPLAILLAVTAGGTLFGLAGAFLAVPALAVTTRAAGHLAHRDEAADP